MYDTLAYLRVSDPRQATPDKVSLEDQRLALEQLATSLGRTLPADAIFADPGVSGGTANRPGFQRLLAHCLAHPTKGGLVLVFRHDRWGRFDDPDEAGHYTFLVRQCGYDVRFAEGSSTDPNVRSILDALQRTSAMQERQKIQSRAKTGMRGATAKGFWVNREPYGYRRVAIDALSGATRVLAPGQRKGQNEVLKLTPGPDEEVAFVRWLFGRYATGTASVTELHRQTSTQTAHRFHWSALLHMLRNPVYAGDLRSGFKAKQVVLVRDAFPALVDRDLWDQVQRCLARNRKHTSPVRYAYPLSGLLHCASCGAPFVGGGRTGKHPADHPQAQFFYKDAGYTKQPRCPGHLMTIQRRDIEPRIIGAVADAMERHQLGARLAVAFDRLLDQGDRAAADRRARAVRTRRQLEARRDRLVAAVGDGTLLKAEADPQLRTVRADLDRLTRELEQHRFDGRRQARLATERDRLVALAMDFRAQAARLEGNELRELLRPWIASGLVDKHARTVTIALRTIPVDCSSLGSAGPAEEAETLPPIVLSLNNRSAACRAREARKRAARAALGHAPRRKSA
jgi:DNA invertase Pin-like site-specific DNA recombinase